MNNLVETISNFVFPYRYLDTPEFRVSRNLMPWDAMVRSLS